MEFVEAREKKIVYSVGAHEPIFHRLRTGNTTADEWARWERETSDENIELLGKLGMSSALLACCKGFGLEAEKPLIERAARFAEKAAKCGIKTGVYVQGFPVYYETFMLETPGAVDWLARKQSGEFIPWGAQTFRRWMDVTRREFWEYEKKELAYVLSVFRPDYMVMDNSTAHPSYTDSSRKSFRDYLKRKYAGADLVHEFGIPSFDAVDLPVFDPVYYPPDAFRIVKDPLVQEWANWLSDTTIDFLAEIKAHVQAIAPKMPFGSGSGCGGFCTNHLFSWKVDLEARIETLDMTGMEESHWRPGVVEGNSATGKIVMDERHPDQSAAQGKVPMRVSTDARWSKVNSNYRRAGHGGFWGEVDRPSKLVALAHNMVFGQDGHQFGTVGPLATDERVLDDIRDVIDWGQANIDVLMDRDERLAPVAVWRERSTWAFIRHKPVWDACAVEQMLFEQHVPFTILLDGGLKKFLAGRKVLVLPGTVCVSDEQVALITEFVRAGGNLLVLGEAGTRDLRTRLRRTWAFAHMFGPGMPNIEYYGPPHWVPELNWSAMPEQMTAKFGAGKVTLIKRITPQTELDLTRDPYMPERSVMVKDILPPANESDMMAALNDLLGAAPRVQGPRWTLCEYWKSGSDLQVSLANLHKKRDGGAVTIDLGSSACKEAQIHMLWEKPVAAKVVGGKLTLDKLPHFAAVVFKNAL